MTNGTFSAIPVAETTIGIAKETERYTPVAPTDYLPASGPKYKPNVQMLNDEGLRGSMADIYDVIPGLRYDGHGWDGNLFLDSVPLLIMGELGSPDTKTTAIASTTLAAAADAAATTISSTASIAAGSWITIDTGAVIETRKATAVTGSGPYTVTLNYPLANAHASGAAVAGLTSHAFSLLNNSPSTGNQPPSFTLSDFGGETSWRQLAGAQLNQFNISGSPDALPKYTCDWFANAATAPSAPTPSFTTQEATPGWTVLVAIGDEQVTYTNMWETDLTRNVKPVPASTGTQAYWQYFAAALAATGKLTVLEDTSSTWLSAYESGTVESLDITLIDPASSNALNIHSSKCKFTSGEIDRSKEWVEVPLELRLLPNSTDALAGGLSPVEITVANSVTTTY